MLRTFMIARAALTLSAAAFAQQGGTAEEARAMLDKAVAAVKADKTKALDMFNKGEGGFLDRDLYVFCNNTTDGTIVALGNPNAKKLLGTDVRNLKDSNGKAYGQEIFAAGQKPEGQTLKSAATCFQDHATQSRLPRTASSRKWAICTAALAIISRPRQKAASADFSPPAPERAIVSARLPATPSSRAGAERHSDRKVSTSRNAHAVVRLVNSQTSRLFDGRVPTVCGCSQPARSLDSHCLPSSSPRSAGRRCRTAPCA